MAHDRKSGGKGALVLGAAAIAGAGALLYQRTRSDAAPGDDEVWPNVLIGLDRDAVHAFFADEANWRRIMSDGEEPAGENRIDAVSAADTISWHWRGDGVTATGTAHLRDAPGDRGTIITLNFAGNDGERGMIGKIIDKLFAASPVGQAQFALRRAKMLLETGEIATADRRIKQEG